MLLRRPSAALFLLRNSCFLAWRFAYSCRPASRAASFAGAGTTACWAWREQRSHFDRPSADGGRDPHAPGRGPFAGELGVAALLLYSSLQFYRQAHRRQLVGLSLLAHHAGLLVRAHGFRPVGLTRRGLGQPGALLGPFPQMLLGIAMVIVLFEIERRSVQENTLTFSTLGVDAGKLMDAPQLVPNIEFILDRLLGAVSGKRAMLCAAEPWRE